MQVSVVFMTFHLLRFRVLSLASFLAWALSAFAALFIDILRVWGLFFPFNPFFCISSAKVSMDFHIFIYIYIYIQHCSKEDGSLFKKKDPQFGGVNVWIFWRSLLFQSKREYSENFEDYCGALRGWDSPITTSWKIKCNFPKIKQADGSCICFSF